MQNQTLVIVKPPTTVKLIVKRKATIKDITNRDANFVVPNNCGHMVAKFVIEKNDCFYFQAQNLEILVFESLENIYLL